MSDGILPALLVLAIEGEVTDDELVDTVQGEALTRAAADGHHYQCVVAVRRFLFSAAELGGGRGG